MDHRIEAAQTSSVWQKGFTATPRAGFLAPNGEYDVVVIGAGIAGLTTAYFLTKNGYRVVVVDRYEVGAGETGRTTAQVATAYDDRYFEMEHLHGREGARLLGESQTEALRLIGGIVAEHRIECDARPVPGYLFLGPEHDAEYLDREREATLRSGVEVGSIASLRPAFSAEKWLVYPDQLAIHPLKYLAGLEREIVSRSGTVLAGSGVADVKWHGENFADTTLENGRVIRSKFVVTATNTPFNDRFAIHTKQAAYRSYVIAAKIPRGILGDAFYWDTSDPYHYVRLAGSPSGFDEKVIIGGEDHKTGQDDSPEKRWRSLEAWARRCIPEMGEVTDRWSGQIMEPVDGVAFAGRNPGDPPGSFIITGDSGNGMTNGTIGAKIVSDLIRGGASRYADLFSPSRKSLRTAGEFLKENLNVAGQYADWLKPGAGTPSAELRPGEGRVYRKHGRPVAIACDRKGHLTECSAVCPHLGAILRWNSAEQSWDCPAHGSRFDTAGKILNDPANRPLSRPKEKRRTPSPEKTRPPENHPTAGV